MVGQSGKIGVKVKIIAFIAARGGSKSIPLKNIKQFCGKPLIYWNLHELSKVKEIVRIYVATDSKNITEIVNGYDLKKVEIYERDSENAQDNSSTESVMLEFINNKSITDNTIFLLSQITCPLTRAEDYSGAINQYKNGSSDSLLSCARLARFFWNENGTPINYDYCNRPRRQEFKGALMENGAFYINSVKNIKKYKNRLSGNISLFEMPEYSAVDIDEPDDWAFAENLMRKNILNKNKNKNKLKLFLTDVDGCLTDAGMYYGEHGDELKKFCTYDGKGLEILRNNQIKTGIITSENVRLVERRAKKLKLDFVYQGIKDKKIILEKLCNKMNIKFEQVAYVGDDLNDYEILTMVGFPACPQNALKKIKEIPGIRVLKKAGGEGAIREFVDYLNGDY